VPTRKVVSFADTGGGIYCDYRASAEAGGSEYVSIGVPSLGVGPTGLSRSRGWKRTATSLRNLGVSAHVTSTVRRPRPWEPCDSRPKLSTPVLLQTPTPGRLPAPELRDRGPARRATAQKDYPIASCPSGKRLADTLR
jgi:hypothetical protein